MFWTYGVSGSLFQHLRAPALRMLWPAKLYECWESPNMQINPWINAEQSDTMFFWARILEFMGFLAAFPSISERLRSG